MKIGICGGESMAQLRFRNLTEEDKRQICAWKYTGEYEIYNLPSYDLMKAQQTGFMNPKNEKNYFAFLDGDVLVGFVNLREKDTEVFIGVGVNPALCGRQYGRRMLEKHTAYPKGDIPKSRCILQCAPGTREQYRAIGTRGFAWTASRMNGQRRLEQVLSSEW